MRRSVRVRSMGWAGIAAVAVIAAAMSGVAGAGGRLDLESYRWAPVTTAAPWSARAGLQAVEQEGDFFVMGGRTPLAIPGAPGASTLWNDVWRSPDRGATWTKVGDAQWPARAYFQAVTLGRRTYVMGGQNFKFGAACPPGAPFCSDFFDDVWSSRDLSTWVQETPKAGWVGRAGLSAVSHRGALFVLGGSANDDAAIVGGPPQRKYFNDVWRSTDRGKTWKQLTSAAEWAPRAGASVVARGGWIYLFGGEEGFTCNDPSKPCPPYFNDVWRSRNGVTWQQVTAAAGWSARPGHQCELLTGQFVCFGGFGLPPAGNPTDMWVSRDGARWTQLPIKPWNVAAQDAVKYDFASLATVDPGRRPAIYTFGGDRETFDFSDPLNPTRVDKDVWRFGS